MSSQRTYLPVCRLRARRRDVAQRHHRFDAPGRGGRDPGPRSRVGDAQRHVYALTAMPSPVGAMVALALSACVESGSHPSSSADIAAEQPITAPLYDLVLKGGRVIDPASGRDGIFDVAIAGDRIAKLAPSVETTR